MVSLGVVVAAILAVVFFVFSDQPATERFRTRRARPAGGPAPAPPPLRPQAARSDIGPPPARVLQRQLALPSFRRTARRPAPSRPGPTGQAATTPVPGPLPATLEGRFEDEAVTFWTRVRSSAALLVLLAGVGTVVALAIGATMFLAGLALRHALR